MIEPDCLFFFLRWSLNGGKRTLLCTSCFFYSLLPGHYHVKNFVNSMLSSPYYSALYQARNNRTSWPWAKPSETVSPDTFFLLSTLALRHSCHSKEKLTPMVMIFFLNIFPLIPLLNSYLCPQLLQPHFCDVCVIASGERRTTKSYIFYPFPNTL